MDLHMDPEAEEQQHSEAEADEVGKGSQFEDQSFGQQQSEPAAEAQGQQHQQLTHTVLSGLEAIASRKQDIHAKIDELGQVVLNHLEQTKLNFLQWMEGYRKMVDEFDASVVHSNTLLAGETIAAQMRLGRAQQLVSSLGLEVMNPPAAAGGADDMVGS